MSENRVLTVKALILVVYHLHCLAGLRRRIAGASQREGKKGAGGKYPRKLPLGGSWVVRSGVIS